jgi:integrase
MIIGRDTSPAASGTVLFRRGRWYARVRYFDVATGRDRDLTKACESKAAARQQKEACLRELEDAGADAVQKGRATFADFAAWFKQTYLVEATYTPDGQKEHGLRSLRTAEINFRTVTTHFGTRRIREIRHSDLRAFRLQRLQTPTRNKTKRSLATVNREMAMARRMFRIARKEGWITRDPFDEGDSLISLARERERERILTRLEEDRLLAACEHPSRAHLRPLVIAALDTGCRQGELLKLIWSDVDVARGTITIRAFNSKTMRERIVGVTPRLRNELLSLRTKKSRASDRVFGMSDNAWFCAKRAWTSARRAAGLENVRFHDLRHTAASRLAQKMSLSDVGKLLGHREPRTTWRYANTDDTTLARAVEILHAFSCDAPPQEPA